MDYLSLRKRGYSGNSVALHVTLKQDLFAVATAAIVIFVQGLNFSSYAQNSTSPSQEWGVILGADRTQEAASKEVADNTKILGQKPGTYMCNGLVRTIAVYRSKQDALKALRKVRAAGSPYSPYIVSLWQWCPGKKLLQQ